MRADAKLKREQLIAAATEHFRTRTTSEVTLEGIAKEAGVGIATLYRHFPTREDLRLACALTLIDTLDELLTDTLATFDDNPQAHWEESIWRLADYGIGVLVSALAEESSNGVDAQVVEKRDHFFRRVQKLIDKAVAHGLVAPGLEPLEMAAELIVVTRPMTSTMNEVFPDVKNRLVRHLLIAWRQPGSAQG